MAFNNKGKQSKYTWKLAQTWASTLPSLDEDPNVECTRPCWRPTTPRVLKTSGGVESH